jgi:glycogen synthase
MDAYSGDEAVQQPSALPDSRSKLRLNLSLMLDPSLIALLNVSTGLPLEAMDKSLQAIKAVLDSLCTKYTAEWDAILGGTAQSLFQSLGGWKSLVLKLHQVAAEILLPAPERLENTLSNAWETTSLLSHISRMKVNPAQVQESLAKVHNLETSIPLISVTLNSQSSHETGAEFPCLIDVQVLWYAVQCCGRFDVYLAGLLASQLETPSLHLHALSLGRDWPIARSIGEKGLEIYQAAQFCHRLFSEQYEWYLLMLSQEGSAGGVEATLHDIETDLRYANLNPCDSSSRKRIERLLVYMMGHRCDAVRSRAIRLLNRFYDSHDWQREWAFDRPEVRVVGEAISIQFGEIAEESLGWSVELVAPSMSPEPHQRDCLTRYCLSGSPSNYELRFPNIVRSGFYDYRLVKLTASGWRQARTVSGKPVMGRMIVQPRLARSLQVCRLLVYEEKGGNFASVTAILDDLCRIGFSALAIEGAAARDNGKVSVDEYTGVRKCDRPEASHAAVTDRASACEFLGGNDGFAELAASARAQNMLTFVDIGASVSSSHKHRKYGSQHLTFIDDLGVKRLFSDLGSESCLLNFRQIETWDCLIGDLLEWPSKFGVAGALLRDACQWPPLLPVDMQEMLRIDPDGERHYSSADVMAGLVVTKNGDFVGYWDSQACLEGFPNPLLVKLCRTVWSQFPGFLFWSDIGENVCRAEGLMRSGILPILGHNPNPMSAYAVVESITELTGRGSIIGLQSEASRAQGRVRSAYTDMVMSLPTVPFLNYREYECLTAGSEEGDGGDGDVGDKGVTPLIVMRPRLSQLLMERTEEIEVAGEHPLELDPLNCIAQYTQWAKTRRRRLGLFSNSKVSRLITSDPMVIAFLIHQSGKESVLGAVNFSSHDALVDIELKLELNSDVQVVVETDLVKGGGPKTPWSREELESTPVLKIVVPQYGSVFRIFRPASGGWLSSELLIASLQRGGAIARREIANAVAGPDCEHVYRLINRLAIKGGLETEEILHQVLKVAGNIDFPRMKAKITKLSSFDENSKSVLENWDLDGPIMFTTPELGEWSTFGGLGVMVDDLVNTMVGLVGEGKIWVVSPYYERNRKGESGYLAKDAIEWTFNIDVDIGVERVTVGVHEKTMNGIRYFFLHNAKYFPIIYPDFQPGMMIGFLALMAKAPLELCCQLKRFPSTIVTNDWATGLTAAYAKKNFFGSVFSRTKFMHIVHNLDQNYEGRIFPQRSEDVGRIHMLPSDLLVDPHWQRFCINPSRCALLTCDNWGTVSVSYRKELLEGSALAPILRLHNHPFAHPNGIPLESRLTRLNALNMPSHWEAKTALQRKYFPGTEPNAHTVLLGFVGRITFQKGIHLILDIAEQLLRRHSGAVQILIGGAANVGEQYATNCAHRMRDLARRYPMNFWADPDAFFVDGPLLNYGCDFGLMPSAFEPGGIVQQEFLIAGTPVIAFKTGGLKDTIFEYYNGEGNGFTFEAHTGGDLAYAVERALKLFWGDRAGYDRLRKNCEKSVISCEMVAEAWLKEFYRMHGKVFVKLDDMDRVIAELDDWVPGDMDEGKYASEPESEGPTSSEEDMDASTEDFFSSSGISVATPASMRSMSRESSVPGILRRSVRVTFKPKLNMEVPRSVLLAGSFDQWASRIPLRWDKVTRVFYVDIRVPQGKWRIKLIVDGAWMCIDDYPTEKDLDGNVNNVIHVD